MYELTQDILSQTGLPAYEVSNHARPGAESRHNLAYWRYEDYIGIGPGAHGRYAENNRRQATENHRAPEVWLTQAKQQGQGLRLREEIDSGTAQREALMMGLRLAEGIDHAVWEDKFGTRLVGGSGSLLSPAKIARLVEEGYVVNDAAKLKAAPAGMQRT